MTDEIITGLDIGSNKIRIAVGQCLSDETNPDRIHLIGAIEVDSDGIVKGVVKDMEDAVASVSKVLEQAERITGVPINSAWVGIAGSHIKVVESKGVVGVSKPDGEIREDDVDRVIEASRTVATPSNYEILHVIPKSFSVDGTSNVKDPVGMAGIRLEVDTMIVEGLSSQINNLTKCVYRTGLDIEDLVFSVLATAEAVLSSRQKELGACVLNIGSSTTNMIVFEEGDVIHTAVLPLGSDHITSDLVYGLRTQFDVAERVKLEHGTTIPKDINKKEEIDLGELGAQEEEWVSRKYIAEIIEARTEEIFEKADDELKKIERSGMLPAGIILTGGGSKLEGMIEVAKSKMKLPASIGRPIGVSGVVDRTHDVSFSTAIGLVMWGSEVQTEKGGRIGNVISRFKSVDNVTKSMKKWLKSLIP